MSEDPKSVGEILDRLHEVGEEHGHVTVGHVVEALGGRSYGPFLLVPALLEVSPVGMIPGLPTVLAAIIALFAVQMLIGRRHMWLAGFLKDRKIEAKKIADASDKLRGVARFLDRWFHGRLPALTKGPAVRVAAALVIVLACTVPPLELLPGATTLPMAAIAAFGLALLVRDGALMVVATALGVGAVAVGAGLFGSRAA